MSRQLYLWPNVHLLAGRSQGLAGHSTQLVARFDEDVIGDEQYALYKLNEASL